MADYKNLRTLFAIITFCIIIFSCEGRKTQNQALKESIEAFKKKVNFETHVYIPETYFEREVDTFLNNGYRVKIKTYSDMSNSVLFSKIKDTINYQTHFRNFKFEISVEKANELIYHESFNKIKVNEAFNYKADLSSSSELYNFDKLAVLKSIEVSDDPSFTDTVVINIMYAIPETDRYASHSLVINEKGISNSLQLEVN